MTRVIGLEQTNSFQSSHTTLLQRIIKTVSAQLWVDMKDLTKRLDEGNMGRLEFYQFNIPIYKSQVKSMQFYAN